MDRSTLALALSIVAVVATVPTGALATQQLITGKQIKDGSVAWRDLAPAVKQKVRLADVFRVKGSASSSSSADCPSTSRLIAGGAEGVPFGGTRLSSSYPLDSYQRWVVSTHWEPGYSTASAQAYAICVPKG